MTNLQPEANGGQPDDAVVDDVRDELGYLPVRLSGEHRRLLAASGISDDIIAARGYRTVSAHNPGHGDDRELTGLGFTQRMRERVKNTPGLLVPLLDKRGDCWGWQLRNFIPDNGLDSQWAKYHSPLGQTNHIDVPPGVGDDLDDPSVPLWITEGSKKADCAFLHGLACIALLGVYGWRGTNDLGGVKALADWEDIALNREVNLAFDSDVIHKQQVRQALSRLAKWMAFRRATVNILMLPHSTGKVGLDDFLMSDGHTVADLEKLLHPFNSKSIFWVHDDWKAATNGQHAPAAADCEAEEAFWSQRPVLAHINDFAKARQVGPYAVLGAVLRRAIALVDPLVQLPPLTGEEASVNLFTIGLGRPGQGKDAANGVARRAVRFVTPNGDEITDPPSAVGVGTGEGLARVFKGHGTNGEGAQRSVNLEVNEIGTLASLADRKGQTLMFELLKAFMGQALGFTNAQKATTTFVPAQSYRLCLGVGAQPDNGGFFLERAKDGLPHRFLWLPTMDPFGVEDGEEPARIDVVLPTFNTIGEAVFLVSIPPDVVARIRAFRHLVNIVSPDVDPLDGHLMLVQEKVAFGLALLESRRVVSLDDWRIAGQLVAVSNRTRSGLLVTLAEKRRKTAADRANEQADRQIIIDERLTESAQDRVWKAITRKLQRVGKATRRDLQRTCDSKLQRDFAAVFDTAVDQGKLVSAGGEGRDTLYTLKA